MHDVQDNSVTLTMIEEDLPQIRGREDVLY